MLVIQDLQVSIEGKRLIWANALTFDKGIHIVMGPNGVGKSTLAHSLIGNPVYSVEGGIKLNDQLLHNMDTNERSEAGLYVSFQNPTPIEGLSNFQMVRQCAKYHAGSKDTSLSNLLAQFKTLAEAYNLPSDWDKRHLNVEASGGEKKKNELIQMEIFEPSCVILDEPDSGLDIDAINVLIDRIKKFNAKKDKVIIIISHYEKLINALNPDTTTILSNSGNSAKQYQGSAVAKEILAKGFKKYT